ncbi:hypothetical protein B0H67DRAFT_366690 [Lasiosphaeris hirsuta]|uniref:Uncharacterized protein n=1 Tax=Lasiosphaeris hirsuta TaxID=260670 RepID=A0AA39ZWJ0_9PEZI|nr:hypothetical protein B0H67DRAFT_366690 [Lasiosphaeris hirsuta]
MSMSDPRSRTGEELAQVRSRAARHRSSNSIGGPIDSKTPSDRMSARPGSMDSNCSPKIVSSTVAIIDRDITDISFHDRPDHDFEHSPCSTNGPFSEDKRLVATNMANNSRLVKEKIDDNARDDDDNEYYGDARLPRPSPPARGLSHHSHHALHHVPSPPEVHVHVDYGSSLSRGTEGEGVRLGNSIVIGTAATAAAAGTVAEDRKSRGRNSPLWRYGDASGVVVGGAL